MYEVKRDHVALTLPISAETGTTTQSPYTRKSCRRYWNQLPRCQRNLIIIGIIACCVTLLLFLPGDQLITDDAKGFGHINIAPFKEDHENSLRHERQGGTNALTTSTDGAKPNVQINQSNQIESQISDGDGEGNIEKKEEDDSNKLSRDVGNEIQENNEDGGANVIEDNLENGPKDFKGPSNERQRAVVEAFRHSWKGYKEFAWGHDNLKPISMTSSDWFGLGLTIVDALDTMYIMDLQDEFEESRMWVDTYLNFDTNREVNLFEVTIRVLGGLLSAYHLSGDKMFLKKSIDLGNRLLPCFESPSGIPYSDVNIKTMKAHSPKWSPDSSTSEVTTIQLEFKDLASASGNKVFYDVVERVNEKVHLLEKKNGLVPIFINANTGTFRNFATISLGARGDSYYEYLLKQWLQSGKKSDDYLIDDYKTAIEGVLSQLVRKTPTEKHTYIGELINGKEFKPKMDHLTCYLPGTLYLGYKNGMPESHFSLAKDLLETCYQTYMKQPTGLAPEITYFRLQDEAETDMIVKSNDAHNLLRPEFIESLYYFYVLTGNRTYQDMGWNIFQSFEKYTKVKHGYTSIGNVKNVLNSRPRDMMESFWLGETLKYFYLLFSDDRNEIDLEKYVFNSEAHLIPIRNY